MTEIVAEAGISKGLFYHYYENKKQVHEIFKSFHRGSNAKGIAKEGAGVGLYLARSIIEQQGGSVVAKRKNGSGTIFQIMLTLSDFEQKETLTKLL